MSKGIQFFTSCFSRLPVDKTHAPILVPKNTKHHTKQSRIETGNLFGTLPSPDSSKSTLKGKIYAFTGLEDLHRSYHEYKRGNYRSSLRSLVKSTAKAALAGTVLYLGHRFLFQKEVKRTPEKLFVNSNERNMKSVEALLRSHAYVQDGCHVGVSAWHNYDIAALTHPKKLIIADFSKTTLDFHAACIELLKKCGSRDEFIQQIAQDILQTPDGQVTEHDFMNHFQFIIWKEDLPIKLEEYFQKIRSDELYDKVLEALKIEMNRPGSWLSSDANFDYIKKLASEGKIISHHVNLVDRNSFLSFAEKLKKNCSKVNTLYLSNAQDWIRTSDAKEQYIQNVKSITENQSIIIDAAIKGDYIYQKAAFQKNWLNQSETVA